MNYYLADNMVEIRELKESNSGKGNFPYLLKKSILPKYPKFTYCPGLNKREEEIYKPEDLILGNYVNVFNRPCFIFDCDEFTKEWFKKVSYSNFKHVNRNETNQKKNKSTQKSSS